MTQTETSAGFLPGARFGKYEIVRLIGAGGMGLVYEALHVDLKRRVAIKTLHPEFAANPDARRRFLREGEAAARIRHPNVVAVTDVDVVGDTPFLVMDFLEGENLADSLARRGRIDFQETMELLIPVFAAVATGHQVGVIHRDLKPANIFLARTALGGVQPMVLDFGVSKLSSVADGSLLTGGAAMLGTIAYMSPEQAQGARDVTPASDEYALALILIEVLSGHRVHDGENALQILAKVIQNERLNIRALLPHVPAGAVSALQRATETDPTRRFGSLLAFGASLLPSAGDRTRLRWGDIFGKEPRTLSSGDEASGEPVRVETVALSGPPLQTRILDPHRFA